MSDILTQGKITPESIRSLREKIDMPLRTRNSYKTSSCYDSVRHYCIGTTTMDTGKANLQTWTAEELAEIENVSYPVFRTDRPLRRAHRLS